MLFPYLVQLFTISVLKCRPVAETLHRGGLHKTSESIDPDHKTQNHQCFSSILQLNIGFNYYLKKMVSLSLIDISARYVLPFVASITPLLPDKKKR